MKALTLWQPWATFMALGDKAIETRGAWALRLRSLVGTDLAVHAAARRPTDAERHVGDWTVAWHPDLGEFFLDHDHHDQMEELPLGAVVAVVHVVAVLPMVDARVPMRDQPSDYLAIAPQVLVVGHHDDARSAVDRNVERERPYGHYEPGRVAIVTDGLRRLEAPVPCAGHQQVWNLPPGVEAAVRDELGMAAAESIEPGRLL